ncbi:MAG: PaaI family thioesterase [Hymenobacter sp.]
MTPDLKVSYLNPGVGQRIKAIGWVLKAGRQLHFCEAEVWCDDAADCQGFGHDGGGRAGMRALNSVSELGYPRVFENPMGGFVEVH